MAQPSMLSWQQPLAALFGGISAAAQPGGWSNFGAGVNQVQQQQQQATVAQQMAELRQMQIEQAQEEMRRSELEREQEATRQRLIQQQLGGVGQPVRQIGDVPGRTVGGAQGQSALLSGMNPQQSALFSTYAQIDPEAAFQMLTERAFAETDVPEPPTVKDFFEGGKVVQKQWNPQSGEWEQVGEGPRWAPQQPQLPVSTNLLTLVSPDGKTTRSVDSRDPQVKTLTERGWIERESSMFPAPPSGYALTPSGLTPIPGGPADPKSKPATADQDRNRQLYQVAKPELDTVLSTFDALADPAAQITSFVPGGNIVQSAEYQRAEASLRTIVASFLYSSSGATANPGEVITQVNVLMPKLGDKPQAIADKKARIANMVDSIRVRAYGVEGAPTAPAVNLGGTSPTAPTGETEIDGYKIRVKP